MIKLPELLLPVFRNGMPTPAPQNTQIQITELNIDMGKDKIIVSFKHTTQHFLGVKHKKMSLLIATSYLLAETLKLIS